MLRKRSRAAASQKEQTQKLMESLSSSSSFPEAPAQKSRSSAASFFNLPGLFVGFRSKGSSDSDSARSPTSPLDFKLLPAAGTSLLLPSPRSPKSWDSGKIGLGIVDSLTDLNTKNIVLGSQVKINAKEKIHVENSSSRLLLSSISTSEIEIEKSEDYTCVISRGGPNPKKTHIFGDLVYESHSIESGEAEKEEEDDEEESSSWIVSCVDASSPPHSFSVFLSFCFSCDRKLEGRDIFMYRGEKAFCSADCREEQILIDENETQKQENCSTSSSSSSAN